MTEQSNGSHYPSKGLLFKSVKGRIKDLPKVYEELLIIPESQSLWGFIYLIQNIR
jgi:hypothetical protein